ncbi:MAG: orotate phosphoribosyltransferase, partial [Pseudomonadales bacterium]|nr:orotate phosphoribosyltransferase [Pseudomonadales bacterium]
RKEAKDHGEGGTIVGAPLKGQVLLIDDVITAGTAVREAVEIINGEGAGLAGIVVAMDRQEKGQGRQSTIQEIASTYNVPVTCIICLQDIIDYLDASSDPVYGEHLAAIDSYREQYGAA